MSVLRAEAALPHSRGMSDPATIQMRNEARKFLREMDPRARSQGRAYHRRVLGEEKFSQSLTLDDLRFLFAEPAEEVIPAYAPPAMS